MLRVLPHDFVFQGATFILPKRLTNLREAVICWLLKRPADGTTNGWYDWQTINWYQTNRPMKRWKSSIAVSIVNYKQPYSWRTCSFWCCRLLSCNFSDASCNLFFVSSNSFILALKNKVIFSCCRKDSIHSIYRRKNTTTEHQTYLISLTWELLLAKLSRKTVSICESMLRYLSE